MFWKSYSSSLQELDLGGCLLVTDAGVSSVTRLCPRLSSLSLSATLITDTSLQVNIIDN